MPKQPEYDGVRLEIDKEGSVVFGDNCPEVHGKWVRWILREVAGWSAYIEDTKGKYEHLFNTGTVIVPSRATSEAAVKMLFDRYANPLFKVRFTD